MTTLLCLLILLGAGAIWFSGTRLVLYVDAIGDRFHLSRAFLGALLLGGITSLPELATTISASLLGNAPLAASNLIGGVAMQTFVLACADLIVLRRALTYVSPNPVLIMGGVLLITQLAFVMLCVVVGEVVVFWNIGLWTLLNFCLFLWFLFLLKNYEGKKRWVATDLPKQAQKSSKHKTYTKRSKHRLWLGVCLHAIPVVLGGVLISYSANRLIEITGLSSTFIGASIVAITTSLPEVTTTFYAVRLGAYTLAISNIFGSNSLMIGLLFIADLFYRKGLVLDALGPATLYLCAIGILVTAAYLWGLLERKNKTILRMGIDSAIVVVVELGGLVGLYWMR